MYFCGLVIKNYMYRKYFSFIEYIILISNNNIYITLIKSGISGARPVGGAAVIKLFLIPLLLRRSQTRRPT